MSLNLHNGAADTEQVAEHAMRADMVILVEATPAALAALKPLGWDERFPYAVGDVRDGIVSNSAVYSRFPLAPGTLIARTAFQQWADGGRGAGDRTGAAARGASVQPLLRRRPMGPGAPAALRGRRRRPRPGR